MEEINKLNTRYKFYDIHNISYKVELNTLEKYQKYDATKKILQSIENNEYGIKNELQNILINRKNYSTYSKEFDLLIDKIKSDCSNDIISKLGLYFKIAIYKLKKKKAALDFNVNIVVSYTSPKGRNHYENNLNYNYDRLVRIALNNQKTVIQEKAYNSQIYEAKREKHYIQCIHCNKLIDLNSIYCTYCGKKQIKTEKNICYEQNKNNNNSNVTNLYGYKDTHNKTFLPAFDDNFFLTKKNNDTSKSIEIINQVSDNKQSKEMSIKKVEEIQNNTDLKQNEDKSQINPNLKLQDLVNEINLDENVETKQNKSEIKTTNSSIDLSSNIDAYSKTNKETSKIILENKKTKQDTISKSYEQDILSNVNYYVEELNKKVTITADNGEKIVEKYFGEIMGPKKTTTKKHKTLLKYFKEKYLNKEIHNYKIIDITLEKLNNTYGARFREIYFYAKCKSCGRIIKQFANDFLVDPLKCKCCNSDTTINEKLLFERIDEKKQLDALWEQQLIPYKIRVIENCRNHIKDEYYDMCIDETPILYLIYENELKRNGFSNITKFNTQESYLKGTFGIFYKEIGYVYYNNVYFSFKSNNRNFNPIFLYKEGNFYKELQINNNTLIDINTFNDMYFIYFEKKQNHEIFNMKIYKNNILVETIKNIDEIDMELLNNEALSMKIYQEYIKKTEDGYSYYGDYDEKVYDLINGNLIDSFNEYASFINTNTNITIDISNNKIPNTLKTIINDIEYVDNKKYKRVYIQKSAYSYNTFLYEYLKKEFGLKKIDNEFDDDKVGNYLAIIPRNKKKEISFIEHLILNSSSDKPYHYRIYNHSIDSIVHLLLSNEKLKEKIINFIETEELLIIEDKYKKSNVINRISSLNQFWDIDGSYRKILGKLIKKYNTDELGLFLILLKKYGEEIVFDLQSTKHVNKYFEERDAIDEYTKYETLMQNILDSNIVDDIKWKSEYTLYLLIKSYFNDAIFQYKFKELEPQSLDIFIPSLNIAFEYQGQQHYEPVERFGGEEHFKIQVENDEKKRKICNENNIILIEWSYQEKINKLELDKQLEKYKNIVETYYEFTKFEE